MIIIAAGSFLLALALPKLIAWAMAFLAVTIVGSSLLLGKKLGALFRA